MPVVVLVFVREKIRHARLVGNKNGIKLSQQEQNAPNWEILGVLGEFCTGTGGVRGVQGEFCTGTGGVWGVQGEFCTGTAGPSSRGASFVPVASAFGRRRVRSGHNKTARRAAGRGWSGRRESNPPLKLGKLPFYR